MLLLELTDGTHTVFGMEYQLIPFLKVTTPPGTKVTYREILFIDLCTGLMNLENFEKKEATIWASHFQNCAKK